MKKSFPASTILKPLSVLLLVLVLVLTPCGIKQSVSQVFNVDLHTGKNITTASACEFLQSKTSQTSKQVVLKRTNFENAVSFNADQNLLSKTGQAGFGKARSVPLYILYRQLRTYLS